MEKYLTLKSELLRAALSVRIEVNHPKPVTQVISGRYNVFIAPSGAVYEFGPSFPTHIRGKATKCDHLAFMQHVRNNWMKK